jgi:hypothetical protein
MADWFEKEQLHIAAQDGDLGRVEVLVQEGSLLNALDELGKTPLHYAAEGDIWRSSDIYWSPVLTPTHVMKARPGIPL